MPRPEDIEKFGNYLLSLGNEPSVLARWGEEVEQHAAEEEFSPELESLLQGFPDEAEAAGDEEPGAEDAEFDDAFLQQFAASMQDELEPDAETAGPPQEPEPDTEPPAAPPDEAGFELPDDIGAEFGADLGDPGDFGDFEASEEPADLEAAPESEGEPAEPELPAEDLADEASETGFDADFDSEGEADVESFTFDPGEFEIDDEIDDLSLEAEPGPDAGPGPGAGVDEFPTSDFEPPAFGIEEDADAEEFSEAAFGDEEDETGDLLEVDEFSLGDFGAEFGLLEEDTGAAEEVLNPAQAISGAPPEAIDAAGPEVKLSDDEFAALQRSVSALPLNVKMAVEEIIADNTASADEIERLISMLVRSEAPRSIAGFAGRILGKQLRLPKGYEKLTGEAYEEQLSSLSFRFRRYVWPVLRLVGAVALILALTGFLIYSYVWQPLYARGIYLDGLEHLAENRYAVANERFAQAETFWRARRWFYRYAEAFVDKRQYSLAVEKYDQLLDHWPLDERGILDYARLESQVLGNYAKARDLLQRLLDEDMYHYGALLASGDNSMEWALLEPERYEDARASYARLIRRHGDTDELLMRMLHYFIRTDNLAEVDHLKNVFQADQRAEIDPLIYAELGGYYLDRGEIREVSDILMRAHARAEQLRESVPEVHYHLARYFRLVENPVEEGRALRNSRRMLEAEEPLNRRRLGMLIETYGRSGLYHAERQDYLEAEELYRIGIRRYEDALERNLLQPEERFGRLYAGLGDIHYYVQRNWEEALRRFRMAEANEFRNREMSYRMGFVHYRAGRLEAARDEFFNAAEGYTTNRAILYATANTLYLTGSYYGAEGYYTELLDELYRDRAKLQALLLDEDPDHRALIEYLIRAQNNLGVALGAVARRETSPEMRRRAMTHLQASQELAVNYRRSPATGGRAEAVHLSYLNLRNILYPLDDFDPQIYTAIPEDFSDRDF